MSEPRVLTIILNYRTPELTISACEAALREMEDMAGEIVVIDNASGDDSFDQLTKAAQDFGWNGNKKVRVLQTGHNGGFGSGMNFGIRAGLSDGSAPEFYYLLNSDAWPDPGCIHKLRDFLIANPGAGLAGSAVRGVDDQHHLTAFRFPSIAGEFEAAARTGVFTKLLRNHVVTLPRPDKEMRVDWTAGASLMIRREAIEATGGFDETFFLYFEETDLCRRALEAGWTTHYLPQSGVVHVGSASTGMKTWARTPQYWFDSRLHYFCKNHGTFYAIVSTISLVTGATIWRLRRLIQSKPQADPDHFLYDLIAHSLRSAFGRRARANPAPSPATEESS